MSKRPIEEVLKGLEHKSKAYQSLIKIQMMALPLTQETVQQHCPAPDGVHPGRWWAMVHQMSRVNDYVTEA